MIYEGERNRKKKVKLINDLKELQRKDAIEQAKRRFILFVCSQCGLQLSFEPKSEYTKSECISFYYDDYKIWFKDRSGFSPYMNNYKNTNRGNWGGYTYICLDCGTGLSDKEVTDNTCEKCGSKNLCAGNELAEKPCPICGTKLNKGIELQGLEALWKKENELKDEWWDIYRERYNVKKTIPLNYTKEEREEQERRDNLIKCYEDDYYVMDNLENVIRFEFRDAWMSGFNCILQWDDTANGKLTLFERFRNIWIEKSIEYDKIKKVINLLKDDDYFNKKYFKNDKIIKIDGYTFGLEVKYGQKYKELALWGIEKGILYDIGMLLLEFAGKTFNELYKYAW